MELFLLLEANETRILLLISLNSIKIDLLLTAFTFSALVALAFVGTLTEVGGGEGSAFGILTGVGILKWNYGVSGGKGLAIA